MVNNAESFLLLFKSLRLTALLGTYECRVDSKFRLPLPAGLQRQWADVLSEGFVLKRSVFQPCIELYPMKEWMRVMEDINKLNRYKKENNTFIRVFTAGLKMVEIDGTGRIQIARDLVNFAGIDKEVVLHPSVSVLEIWNKQRYEKSVDINEDEFAALTEKVLGGVENDE